MVDANEYIIEAIAAEMDLPVWQVRKAVDAQLALVKKIMKKGEFEEVYLQYLGRFKVDKRRVQHINAKKEARNE